MKVKKRLFTSKGYALIAVIASVFIIVTVIKILTPSQDLYHFFIRLFALWGYMFMAIAVCITPFLKEVMRTFGKPFLKIHHFFAYIGICLITLHPVLLLMQTMDIKILLPNFSSWQQFWIFAGRPAIIILYIALIGIWLRKKIRHWRIIHALMHLVLLMGFVHGLLIGTDFTNRAIVFIFSIIYGLTVISFLIKRLNKYRILRNKKIT